MMPRYTITTKKSKNGSIDIPKDAKILAYYMNTRGEGKQPEFTIIYLNPNKEDAKP